MFEIFVGKVAWSVGIGGLRALAWEVLRQEGPTYDPCKGRGVIIACNSFKLCSSSKHCLQPH